MAAIVSPKFVSGSRPETNVSEHKTFAMKPVATFGTSRARTAVTASALSAVVAARARMRRRRVMAVSGWATAGQKPCPTQRRSPDSEIGLAEAGERLADFEIAI
jgi:antitoxin (DNA-binding transcriptional repressor) of toxin-antitoxin stability system